MIPPECLQSCVSLNTVFHVLLWIFFKVSRDCAKHCLKHGERGRGGSFPRLPAFYCLGPQLGLVCWFFAESFNGEHLLLCFLVLQAEEICVQRGSEGGEIEGRN